MNKRKGKEGKKECYGGFNSHLSFVPFLFFFFFFFNLTPEKIKKLPSYYIFPFPYYAIKPWYYIMTGKGRDINKLCPSTNNVEVPTKSQWQVPYCSVIFFDLASSLTLETMLGGGDDQLQWNTVAFWIGLAWKMTILLIYIEIIMWGLFGYFWVVDQNMTRLC